MRQGVSVNDFALGEMVRFKTAKGQRNAVPRGYLDILGHLCIVEATSTDDNSHSGDEYDIIIVRSIGTNKQVKCYVHRLEKYDGEV